MTPTGRSVRRRPSAPSVSRLDGSAHCRSSRPITRGPASASSSTRSVKASTTRNRRPGSLVTVIGPWSPAAGAASSPAMAARRGSGDDRVHPKAAASTPNGRVRSSSSARPAATCMPRPRASCQGLREQARLADPGLALDQHDRWPASSNTVQGLAQGLDLSLTPADPRDRGHRAHDRMVLRSRRACPGSQPRHGHGPGRASSPGSAVTSYSARSSPSQPVKPISCPARGPGSCPGAPDDPKTASRRLGPVQDDTDLHTPIVPAPAAGTISQLADARSSMRSANWPSHDPAISRHHRAPARTWSWSGR